MKGYVIRVTTPGEDPALYAVLAHSLEEAVVAVSDALQATIEEVTFHQVLTEGLVRQRGLEPGHVKRVG